MKPLSPQKIRVLRALLDRAGPVGVIVGNPRTWWSLVGQGFVRHKPLYWKGRPRIVRGDGFIITAAGRKELRRAVKGLSPYAERELREARALDDEGRMMAAMQEEGWS